MAALARDRVTTANEIADYYYANYYDVCQADILKRRAG